MDPSEVRARLAALLSSDAPVDAGTLNLACFWISRELVGAGFAVPEAEMLARCLLRGAGRLLIDTAAPGADPSGWPATEETILLWLDGALAPLGYRVKPDPGGERPELPDQSAEWH